MPYKAIIIFTHIDDTSKNTQTHKHGTCKQIKRKAINTYARVHKKTCSIVSNKSIHSKIEIDKQKKC